MTIAVDFDGTIVEHRYPRIGREIPFATDTLKLLQQDQHRLICGVCAKVNFWKKPLPGAKKEEWNSMLSIVIIPKRSSRTVDSPVN